MSVYLYDDAIVTKLRNWRSNNDITISVPENLFTYLADINNDRIKLPQISLIRLPDIEILNTNKKMLSREGLSYNVNETNISTLSAIPIRISYQLDIYTRKRKDNDDLMREIIFKLINNPRLEIEIPYNHSDKSHYFNLKLNSTIVDNSNVAEHLEKGEFFRSTLDLYVDDAYLFNYRIKDTLSLEVEVETN